MLCKTEDVVWIYLPEKLKHTYAHSDVCNEYTIEMCAV